MIDYLATFVFFFAVIDPIGTVPVFLAVTRHHSEQRRRQIAVKSAVVAALVLIVFAIGGEVLLKVMDIPLSSFEIAGGIVLFLFALSMIFGESKPEEEVRLAEQCETAIYPLAVPSIAGPGAMLAAVLLTDNKRFGVLEQAQTLAVMLVVLLIAMILMLLSGRIFRLIGDGGASIISRVMGLILASVAITHILGGIRAEFGI